MGMSPDLDTLKRLNTVQYDSEMPVFASWNEVNTLATATVLIDLGGVDERW